MEAFLLGLLIGAFAVFLVCENAHGQIPLASGAAWGGPFHSGYVEDSARVAMEESWDARNPAQVERGYCLMPEDVRFDTSFDRSAVDVHIHDVHAPQSVEEATPYALDFHCPDGYIGTVHTHTPTTCVRKENDRKGRAAALCIVGGDDAYACNVDEWDRHDARQAHELVTIVQCDKHAFVFYFDKRRG